MDTFTSVLGGVTIFAILGNLAHISGKSVDKVVDNGFGLAFITYPEAISKIGAALGVDSYWAQAMAIFFFGMLFTLGVGSAVGLLNNVTTNLKDFFPKVKQWQFALFGSTFGFLFGLVYITEGGIHVLGIVDTLGGQVLIFLLAFFELIGIVWIYGIENICWDIEFLLKRKVTPYWKISWFIIMPVFLLIIGTYWATFGWVTLTYGKNKEYPLLITCICWGIVVVGFSQIAFAALYVKSKRNNESGSTLKYLVSPNPEWGPANHKNRQHWIEFKEDKIRERDQLQQKLGHSWFMQKLWFLVGKYP
jgi:solute carrier family 6 (neurotransmitter transporter, glycine) member 5/9